MGTSSPKEDAEQEIASLPPPCAAAPRDTHAVSGTKPLPALQQQTGARVSAVTVDGVFPAVFRMVGCAANSHTLGDEPETDCAGFYQLC